MVFNMTLSNLFIVTFLNDGTEPKLTCLLLHGRNWLKVYPEDLFVNLNDLFYISDFRKVFNSADGRTFHACDNDLNNLIKKLEHDAFLAIGWFTAKNMKLNQGNWQLLVARHQYENVSDKMGMKKFGKVKNKNYFE